MPTYPMEIEIERLNNVARNFGWTEAKRETIGDELFITYKKSFPAAGEGKTEAEAG